jgi:hypothetical protein
MLIVVPAIFWLMWLFKSQAPRRKTGTGSE